MAKIRQIFNSLFSTESAETKLSTREIEIKKILTELQDNIKNLQIKMRDVRHSLNAGKDPVDADELEEELERDIKALNTVTVQLNKTANLFLQCRPGDFDEDTLDLLRTDLDALSQEMHNQIEFTKEMKVKYMSADLNNTLITVEEKLKNICRDFEGFGRLHIEIDSNKKSLS